MNRMVLIVLITLIVLVGIFVFLNTEDAEERLLSQREAKIFLVADGERQATVDFETMLKLEQHRFTATLRTSGGVVRDHQYRGIQLKDLLESYYADPTNWEQVITRAADGYTVAVAMSEVMVKDKVYIVYEIDGDHMASREDGGSGPFQLIIRGDQFGQRWNKYLMEIEVR